MYREEDEQDVSSDSNIELLEVDNLDYLHEKLGIYVKDHSGSTKDKSQLVELLPAEFAVVIVAYSDEEPSHNVPGFSCTLRLSIRDKDTILRWFKLFQQKTNTVWRVDSTFKCEKSKKLVFKKNFRCQNNQYNHPNRNKENSRKKRVEHTACPAKLSLTIKNHGMQRTSDTYLKEYPAVINIRFTHNHTFTSPNEYLQCVNPIITLPEAIPVDENYINSSNIRHNTEIYQNDNKKCILTNTEWNKIICDEIFDNEPSPVYFEKDNENTKDETHLYECIDKLCSQLKNKVITKPEIYNLPIIKFIESFNSIKSDDQLVIALNSFCISSQSDIEYKKEPYANIENSNLVNISLAGGVQPGNHDTSYKADKGEKLLNTNAGRQYFGFM